MLFSTMEGVKGLSQATSVLLQGMMKSEKAFSKAASEISAPLESQNDLTSSLLDLKISALSYQANGKALQRIDKVSKSLLDIIS